MGFRGGGVKLTPPPQHILVFKYPSRDRVNGMGGSKRWLLNYDIELVEPFFSNFFFMNYSYIITIFINNKIKFLHRFLKLIN